MSNYEVNTKLAKPFIKIETEEEKLNLLAYQNARENMQRADAMIPINPDSGMRPALVKTDENYEQSYRLCEHYRNNGAMKSEIKDNLISAACFDTRGNVQMQISLPLNNPTFNSVIPTWEIESTETYSPAILPKEYPEIQKKTADEKISIIRADEGMDIRIWGNSVELVKHGIIVMLQEKCRRICSGKSEKGEAAFRFRIQNGMNLVETEVSASDLQKKDWLLSALDYLLILDADEYKEFLYALFKMIRTAEMQEISLFNSNGWQKVKNQYCYVLAQGIVGNPAYPIRGLKQFSYPNLVNVDERSLYRKTWEMCQICNDSSIMTVSMLYVLASFLSAIFEWAGFPVKCVLALIGETGSKKTTLATLIGKIFNREERTPRANFLSTNAGIYRLIQEHADQVLIVDDIRPAMSKGENSIQRQKVEEITICYGDRVQKQYAKGHANETLDVIRGGCILTGEYIEGSESSFLRRVELRMQKNSVNNCVLSYYQQNDFWPTFIYHFLSYVTVNVPYVIAEIAKTASFERNRYYFKEARRNEQYAIFMAMAKMVVEYGNYCEAFSNGRECMQWAEVLQNDIFKVICENDARSIEMTPQAIAMKALYDEIKNGNIAPLSSETSKMITKSEDRFFIKREDLVNIANEYISRNSLLLNKIEWKILSKKLEEEKLIVVKCDHEKIGEEKEKDHVRRTMERPGTNDKIRYVHILQDRFYEYIEKNLGLQE